MSTSSFGSETALLDDNFDRKSFSINLIAFGLPTLLFFSLTALLAHEADYQVRWFFDYLGASKRWDIKWGTGVYERVLPGIIVADLVLMAYPFILVLAWGIAAAVGINRLYGVTVITINTALMLAWFSFMHWRSNSYRMNTVPRTGFALAFVLVMIFQLWVIFSSDFDFVALSAVFLGFSMLPVTQLVFRLAQGPVLPIVEYKEIASNLTEKWLAGEDEDIETDKEGKVGEKEGKLNNAGLLGTLQEEKALDVNVSSGGGPDITNESRIKTFKEGVPYFGQAGFSTINIILLSIWGLSLLAYGICGIVLEPDGTRGVVAFITAAAVAVIDLTILGAVLNNKYESPLYAVWVMIFTRVLLVIFGDRHYFVGHALVFLIFAVFIGIGVVNALNPPTSVKREKTRILEKLGFVQQSPERVFLMQEFQKRSRLGQLKHTRFGHYFSEYYEVFALAVFTVMFALDIALAATVAQDRFSVSEVNATYAQWVLGIISLFTASYVTATYATWRFFNNRGREVDPLIAIVVVVKNTWLALAGVVIWLVSTSVFAMNVFIFFPWAFDLGVLYCVKWAENDFQFVQHPRHRSPPCAPFCWSLIRMRLPRQDYFLLLVGFLEFFVVGLFGLIVGLTDDANFLGYCIPFVIYSIAFAFLPTAQWFYTLEFTWFQPILAAVALFFHTLFAILLFTATLRSENSLGALGLLFYYLMFPSLSALIFAAYKFKDDQKFKAQREKLTEKRRAILAQSRQKKKTNDDGDRVDDVKQHSSADTKLDSKVSNSSSETTQENEESIVIDPWLIMVTVNVVFFYIFLIAAVLLFFSLSTGLSLIVLYTVLLIIFAPRDVLRNFLSDRGVQYLNKCCDCFQGYLTGCYISFDTYIYLAIAIFALAFAIGVGINSKNGFLGFSFVWAAIFISMVASSYLDFKDSFEKEEMTYLASPNVFPVFAIQSGSRIQPDNERIYAIYFEALMAFLWGVIAVFMFSEWIGFGVSSLAIAIAYAITVSLETTALVQFRDAMEYLRKVEESDSFLQLVKTAQRNAYADHVSDQRTATISKKKSTFGNIIRKLKNKARNSISSVRRMSLSANNSRANSARASLEGINIDLKSEEPGQSGETDDAEEGGAAQEEKKRKRRLTIGDIGSDSSLNDGSLISAMQAANMEDFQTYDVGMAEQGIHTWDDARMRKKLLLSRIPNLMWMLPFPLPSKEEKDKPLNPLIPWTGGNGGKVELTRAQAVREAIKLNFYESIRYMLFTRFLVQSVVNIISRAEGEKKTNTSLVANMLQERGLEITADEFRVMNTSTLEYVAIEVAFRKYLKERRRKQNENQQDKDIIGLDPEIANRLAEEEARRVEQERIRQEQERKRQEKEEEERRKELERLEKEQKEQEEREKREREAYERKLEENKRKEEEERKRLEQQKLEKEKMEEFERKMREQKKLLEMQKRENEAAERKKREELERKIRLKREMEEKAKKKREKEKRRKALMKRNQYIVLPDTDGGEMEIPDPTSRVEREWKGRKDPEFGPKREQGKSALYINTNKPRHKNWSKYKWVSISEHLKKQGKTPHLFEDDIEPSDIRQGQLGDCWFLSAIAVLSQHRKRLESVFLNTDSKNGLYSVRFFKNNELKVVTVDDTFLVNRYNRPVFARSKNNTELWVMLLEKAYAKLHTCYEAIEAGFVDQALVDMTNGISSRYDMTKDVTKAKISDGSLWQTLINYHQQGFLMGAGTPSGSDSEANASYWGIVQGHAYSILDMFQLDTGINLIRLRNPWGRKEWTGDWSDESPKWTRRYQKIVEMRTNKKFVSADDGAFWMSFRDFTIHFEDIYICRFFEPEAGWIPKTPYFGEWDDTNDGGCTNNVSVHRSPQFHLTCLKPGATTVVLNLAQEDARGKFDQGTGKQMKKAAIAIEIYQNRGRRVSRSKSGKKLKSNPRGYVYSREVTCEVTLPQYFRKGELTAYTVLVSTFHPKVHRKFTVRAYSNQSIKLEALKPPQKKT